MRRSWLVLILVVVLFLSGCNSPQVSVMDRPEEEVLNSFQESIVLAHNRFGFDVMKALDEHNENLLVSPISLSMAFAMALNGTGGETEEEMAAVLHLAGWEREQINNNLLSLLYFLRTADPEVVLDIANSAWIKEGVPLEEEYLQTVAKYLLAEAEELDFQDSEAADTINSWVEENTRGLITQVVEPPINPLTILFLINTVYFDGNWAYPFNPSNTTEQTFTALDGTRLSVPMMTQSERFPYYENEQVQMIRLPYGDEERMSMVLILPREDMDWEQMHTLWGEATWQEWKPGMREKLGTVTLPRLDFSYEASLVDTMKSLGLNLAFDPTAADFSRMISPLVSNDVHISDIIHKTRIRVDEEGTEAAAVTSIEVGVTSMPNYEFDMRLDRPFLFMIEDALTGSILFMGHVVNPSQ